MSARPRSAKQLWHLSISARPEHEEALMAWLTEAAGQPASGYTNLLTRRTRVSLFLDSAQLPDAAALRRLRAVLRGLPLQPSPAAPLRLRLAPVRREDWAESWKKHFPPLEIGRALLLRPSWSTRKPRRGQALLTLDPGMSFGTGQHATTAFCLKQVVAFRRADARQSCLDVGTGSGILALAAARLGYAPVAAFDYDPEAVGVARANAAANGLARQIRFSRADVLKLTRRRGKRFDLICANLLANLLIAACDLLLARLAPGGRIVVAGILKSEFASVQQVYEAAGLRLVASRAQREWRSGAFE